MLRIKVPSYYSLFFAMKTRRRKGGSTLLDTFTSGVEIGRMPQDCPLLCIVSIDDELYTFAPHYIHVFVRLRIALV